ncbi:glucosaminidase domain-containing protein [Avibacterium endocarditidis]|uniref:glucosaminidase domain-containing protein n=1 Tax=Avibacterium endocarditidis TaxID=380674 RepID=UPI0039FCC424
MCSHCYSSVCCLGRTRDADNRVCCYFILILIYKGWTSEYINGKKTSIKQKFRDYENIEAALQDRYHFTNKKSGRYDKAGYFTATSPAEAAMELQKAGYATDPKYANSLIVFRRLASLGISAYHCILGINAVRACSR